MTDCTGGFMANPKSQYYVPDDSIQASSSESYDYRASYGRLHAENKYWEPAGDDAKPWIEADLGRSVDVYGIQTQGDYTRSWVTTLKVSTFQQVYNYEYDGDFIKEEWNEFKVCNVYKKTEMSLEHYDRPDNIIIDRPI